MGLVDYGSSEEEGEAEEKTSPFTVSSTAITSSVHSKRKVVDNEPTSNLPPLPANFHDLYASNTRVSTRDDPNLHGGRKRVTPHVQGNWPTHLYIEWNPVLGEFKLLEKTIEVIQKRSSQDNKIETFLESDLGAPLPLHISLSRPIGFATDQKKGFFTSLQNQVIRYGIKPFEVSFSKLVWVSNFTKTRWFLVLKVVQPQQNELNQLLALCNSTVEDYGQPPLYSEPSKPSAGAGHQAKKQRLKAGVEPQAEFPDQSDAFHISIAWSLTAPEEDDQKLLDSIMQTDSFQEIKKIKVSVTALKVKLGNEVLGIYLESASSTSRTLLGQ